VLQSERLTLRTMTIDDAEPLMAVFTDPMVMASFGGGSFDREQMERWVVRNLAHQKEHGYGLFTVVHQRDGVIIGDCGLEHMEVGGFAEIELGYDLRSDYWGRGLATEAAIAVRDHAFHDLGVERLISLIRPDNGASCRVAEKTGMVHERDLPRGGIPYRLYAVAR
jgi:ribosomal-protein-alanine N-acetyltransferase